MQIQDEVNTTQTRHLDLRLEDLEISEVEIAALTTEDSTGIPDLSASLSYYSCTFC